MQRTIFIAVIVVGVIVAGVAYYMLRGTTSTPPATTQTTTQTNVPANNSQQTSKPPSVLTFPVTFANGKQVFVRDFTKDTSTILDTNNPGHYYIYGGLNPTGTNAPYSIFYNATDQSFDVTLLKEPLGDQRVAAEKYLAQKLQVSQQTMCHLRYFVSVPTYIDATLSTKNLGFSFCPGATQLQ